jgi:hypothetical protein
LDEWRSEREWTDEEWEQYNADQQLLQLSETKPEDEQRAERLGAESELALQANLISVLGLNFQSLCRPDIYPQNTSEFADMLDLWDWYFKNAMQRHSGRNPKQWKDAEAESEQSFWKQIKKRLKNKELLKAWTETSGPMYNEHGQRQHREEPEGLPMGSAPTEAQGLPTGSAQTTAMTQEQIAASIDWSAAGTEDAIMAPPALEASMTQDQLHDLTYGPDISEKCLWLQAQGYNPSTQIFLDSFLYKDYDNDPRLLPPLWIEPIRPHTMWQRCQAEAGDKIPRLSYISYLRGLLVRDAMERGFELDKEGIIREVFSDCCPP